MPIRSWLCAVLAFAIAGPASPADPPEPAGRGNEARENSGAKLEQITRLIQAADHLDAAGATELAWQTRQRATALIEEERGRLADEQAKLQDLTRALTQTQIAIQVLIAESTRLRPDGLARQLHQLGGVEIDAEPPGRNDAVFAAHLSSSDAPVDVLLGSLSSLGAEVEVFSRPQILTLDGSPAEVQIGQVVPVVNGVTVSRYGVPRPEVVADHAGIRLSVTPSVVSGGQVRLDLRVEHSAFSEDGVPLFVHPTTGETVTAPVKSVTSAQAAFTVPEERVLFLAVPTTARDAAGKPGEQKTRPMLLLMLEPRVLLERR